MAWMGKRKGEGMPAKAAGAPRRAGRAAVADPGKGLLPDVAAVMRENAALRRENVRLGNEVRILRDKVERGGSPRDAAC